MKNVKEQSQVGTRKSAHDGVLFVEYQQPESFEEFSASLPLEEGWEQAVVVSRLQKYQDCAGEYLKAMGYADGLDDVDFRTHKQVAVNPDTGRHNVDFSPVHLAGVLDRRCSSALRKIESGKLSATLLSVMEAERAYADLQIAIMERSYIVRQQKAGESVNWERAMNDWEVEYAKLEKKHGDKKKVDDLIAKKYSASDHSIKSSTVTTMRSKWGIPRK